MAWTVADIARLGLIIAMLVTTVAFIERRRAAGKLSQAEYSYVSVWKVVGVGILVSTLLAGLVYVRTGSAEHAFGLGGILVGVVLFGSLRGFFSEYQQKRRGAKKLDKP